MEQVTITETEDLVATIYSTILKNEIVNGKEIISGKIVQYQGRVIFTNVKDLTFAILRINKKTILTTFDSKVDGFIIYFNSEMGVDQPSDIDHYINSISTGKIGGCEISYSEFKEYLLTAVA